MRCKRKTTQKNQRGMAVLSVTMVVLAIVTIITFFSARIIVTDNKIAQNQENAADAFNAAQAGIDYALGYLNASATNRSAIITTGLSNCASASNTRCLASGTLQACGASPAADPTTTLTANNATYTMRYSCVTANSGATLMISSLGASADGTGKRTLTVMVKRYFNPTAITAPAIISANTLNMNGSAIIRNAGGTTNVIMQSTGNFDMAAGSATYLNNSTSCTVLNRQCTTWGTVNNGVAGTGNVGSDITTDATLSAATLETRYLGMAIADFAPVADYTFTCTGNGSFTFTASANGGANCSVSPAIGGTGFLSGMTGQKVIYFNLTGGSSPNLIFSGTFTIGTNGSAFNPIIVVNSAATNPTVAVQSGATLNASIYTNTTPTVNNGTASVVNGAVFTTRTMQFTGSNATANVNGGVVAGTGFTIASGSRLSYSATNVAGAGSFAGYGIVSGSWRDF